MIAPTGTSAPVTSSELLLRETNHRCSNDLQLVVSLLSLQSRRAASLEVRQALNDAMERVAVLARSRQGFYDGRTQSLNGALQHVCDALHAQAEPRLILIVYEPGEGFDGLSAACVTTLALVTNELVTNAIKHAFDEGRHGCIHVAAKTRGRDVIVLVGDDGCPFPDPGMSRSGMGMEIAARMMAAINGLLIPPPAGSKVFELRVPAR